VNCQEKTKEKLLETLKITLKEALEFISLNKTIQRLPAGR